MTIRIINSDVMDGLRSLPDDSVDCVVTSPPYWGLRDYGVEGQIGLEKTPDEFVARLVEVFREVRRVLKADGTCWVNLGDSYANDGKWGGSTSGKHVTGLHGDGIGRGKRDTGLKPKDLVGIPWRVAFALQADGWWLRQDIIWAKPNPMPESVTDRCTKSHEYVFLLTKSARYFYDAEAISEPSIYPGDEGYLRGPIHEASDKVTWRAQSQMDRKKARQNVPKGGFGGKTADTEQPAFRAIKESRNKRSVWTIATAPFPEAHFATFPPELPELCIKAGCRPGGTVLDPFSGAGTTALVADRLQRHAIGIELNPTYAAMSERRIASDRGGLLDLMEQA